MSRHQNEHVELACAEARGIECDLAAWHGEVRGRIVIGALPLSARSAAKCGASLSNCPAPIGSLAWPFEKRAPSPDLVVILSRGPHFRDDYKV